MEDPTLMPTRLAPERAMTGIKVAALIIRALTASPTASEAVLTLRARKSQVAEKRAPEIEESEAAPTRLCQ